MNIVQALNDPKVFGRFFKAEGWNAWRVFLAALFGLPLGYDQMQLYKRCTGRTVAPSEPLQEAWLVVGRRGGRTERLPQWARVRGLARSGPTAEFHRRQTSPGRDIQARQPIFTPASDKRRQRQFLPPALTHYTTLTRTP